MPTGSGKSLLYQLPAAAPGPGLVLVCSPLIALMRDQLRTLADSGVGAVALHSMQEDDEAAASIDAVASGLAKLLYAAPERLAQEGTQHLLRSIRIKLFAIDEAHCVSHWGHEFRPDYRMLGDIARKLGAPPTLAVTATAGPRTRDDIARTLFSRPAEIFLRSFARPIYPSISRKNAPACARSSNSRARAARPARKAASSIATRATRPTRSPATSRGSASMRFPIMPGSTPIRARRVRTPSSPARAR